MSRSLKAVTDESQFRSVLNERLQEICERDLKETDFLRSQALRTLREWIDKNPRITKCRYDDMFLLRFLRAKKYNMLEVQDCLERYVLLRKSYSGSLFEKLDLEDSKLDDLFNEGYIFVLPRRDALGRRVLFLRAAAFNTNRFINNDMIRVHALVAETLLETDEVQANGLVYILDGEGADLSIASLFTPAEAARIIKNGEKIVPLRHKEVYILSIPSSVKFFVDFGFSLISNKMKKRVIFPKNFGEIKHISLDMLPKEYGGIMPAKEMIRLWKEEMKVMQQRVLLNDEMECRCDMYSPASRNGDLSALNKPLDAKLEEDEVLGGTNGAFRQLAID